MRKHRSGTDGISEAVDRSVQNGAIALIAAIFVLLFVFTAVQSGMFGLTGCGYAETVGQNASETDSPVSDTDEVSDADSAADSGDTADDAVSDSDTVSESDTLVIYYPEVHIDGITLPEEYGAGLFDPDAVMWLINEYRRQNGVYPLLPGEFGLQQVARIRLMEITELFSHDRPDGTGFATVYDQTGLYYRYCAENLASGQYTAEEVVRDWIASDTHRANLLSTSVNRMCVMAATLEDGRTVWVFEAYTPL